MATFPTQDTIRLTVEVMCDECRHRYAIAYTDTRGELTRIAVRPHDCDAVRRLEDV